MLATVLDHLLEGGPLIIGPGLGSVRVLFDHFDAVSFGVSLAVSDLTSKGFFPLP